MANIVVVLTNLIRPYYYYIIVFVMIVIFGVIGYYAYNNLVSKEKNRIKDVANANRRNVETIVYFFHVDWCPHCKTALPEWKKFVANYNGKEINGYGLKCVDVNCTSETSDVTEFINKYKIESYPTVKLIRDGDVIDFDSKITSTSLDKFVNTMLY
jgi:thiol-disulfide isomerase/thioredoxin